MDPEQEGVFPNSQGTKDTDQINEDVNPEILEINDPGNQNLGENRAKTRYNLREKPVRNRKYYSTRLEGDYINNLRKWTRKEPTTEIKDAPKILRVYILPKVSKLKQINLLDALPKDHLKALRVGYLLQKELGIAPRNSLLADFLFEGNFVGSKNALHHQDLDGSFSTYRKKNNKIPGKKVTFEEGLILEKPAKMVRVNFQLYWPAVTMGRAYLR